MTFSTKQLAEEVGGLLVGDATTQCLGGAIDSRLCERGNVFFALKGEHSDGHNFIDAAIEAGCSAVVVERKVQSTVPVVKVDDVRKSLFALAMSRRAGFGSTKVIAITGSVGKTTTKDMIASMLGKEAVASRKSFNNDLGVPLTILAGEGAEYLVAEVGANDVGEIEPLAQLVQPDISVLTSIDSAHLEGFGDKETVLAEKVKLLEVLPSNGIAILPEGIDLSPFDVKATIYRVGRSENADVQIKTGMNALGYATLQIGEDVVTLSLLGEHNAWNAAFAIVACMLGNPTLLKKDLMNMVSSIMPPTGRLQVNTIGGITFIDDSYNANPASMRSALELFQVIEGNRRVLILGDMLELGEHSHAEHRLLGSAIERVEADVVILIGPHMKITSQVTPSIHEYESSDDALKRISSLLKQGDTVLLKGSRAMQLERVIELKRQTKVSAL